MQHARLALSTFAAFAVACSTTMMIVDGGPDASTSDASADGGDATKPIDSGMGGKDTAADCGMVDIDDASTCDPVSKCSADPAPDAAGCLAIMDGSCADPYKLLIQCQRKNTVCNGANCTTDPIKTGISLQQNCANQQTTFDTCN
jgi:hypothetical protein